MIILSGVLVVVAIALLVTGIVTGNTGHEVLGLDGLRLIYISIGVSIVSALSLAIGVFIRRKDLFGAGTPAEVPARLGKTRGGPVRSKAKVPAATVPAPAPRVPAETTVFIVPGRKRYHLENCRHLAGRDKEELTFSEARDEGFTACTACLPDTALAARAAQADTGEHETVEVTRTDLPVTTDLPVITDVSATTELPVTDDLPATTDDDEPEGDTSPSDEHALTRSFFEPLDRGEEDEDAPPARPGGGSSSVRVIKGTKRYHLPDCALIDDIAEDADDVETLQLTEAQDGGCTPCLVCQPDKRLAD